MAAWSPWSTTRTTPRSRAPTWRAPGFAETAEVRVGPALDTLPALEARREPFDLVFIDADKQPYPEYLEWALRLTRPGALIVADNVVGVAARWPPTR